MSLLWNIITFIGVVLGATIYLYYWSYLIKNFKLAIIIAILTAIFILIVLNANHQQILLSGEVELFIQKMTINKVLAE